MAVIKAGSLAPDFTLRDHHNREFRLSDLRGRKVLLSWHPLAFTRVCARQMQSLEGSLRSLGKLGVVPVGLSADAVPSKHAWARAIKVRNLRMLSDFWPHGGAAMKYGLLRKEGFSERANVLVDGNGRVAWVKVYPLSELPDIKEVLRAASQN